MGNRLRCWIDGNWPGATWRYEWPLSFRDGRGTETHGIADLILETKSGVVIIDHKTFPGATDQAAEVAVGYTAQLETYGRIAALTLGQPVIGTWVHLPVLGLGVPVNTPTAGVGDQHKLR